MTKQDFTKTIFSLPHTKLLIVDGSNLLFQMFFGMPARIIGANGKAIPADQQKAEPVSGYA